MITLIQGPIAKALESFLSAPVTIIDADAATAKMPMPTAIAEITKRVAGAMKRSDVILVTLNPRLRKRLQQAGIDIQRTITIDNPVH